MKLLKSLCNFYAFIFLIISLQFVSPFHWEGNTMYDLESVTKFGFEQEAYTWACSNALTTPGVLSSKCGSIFIIGGYNIVAGSGAAYSGHNFYKSYSNLPPHNQIRMSIKIFPVDSWDLANNDRFTIVIDGTTIGGWAVTYTSPFATADICGNPSYNEYPAFTAYVTFPHIDTNIVTLQIYGFFNEDSTNESLGFRDIIMTFETVTSPATTLCGVSPATLPDKACACPDSHQYQNPATSGTCSGCHVSCNTCSGGSSTNCQSCFPQAYQSGSQCLPCNSPCSECSGGSLNQCTSCIAGYFLVGSTCYPTCESPLFSTINGAVVSCETPCSSSFAMWDGSCSAVCDPPFDPQLVNTFQLCKFPCDMNEYLYWNTSCKATCPGPLSSSMILGRKYCDYSCGASQWLYWDGSCENSCDFPLSQRVDDSMNFCDYPCQPEEFLYWNGSCKASCPGGLTTRIEGSPARKYCDYGCTGSDFLYWDGSCQGSCDFPLSQRIEGDMTLNNFCDYPCQPEEYLYWNGTCLGNCNKPLEKRIEGTSEPRQYCDFPCATTTDNLYANKNCSLDCPYPFSSIAEGSPMIRNYCYFPCENDEFWSWAESTCLKACQSPLIMEAWDPFFQFCHLPCANTEPFYMMDTGGCKEKCKHPYKADYEKTYFRCFPPEPDPFKDIPSGSLVVASVDKGTVSIVTLVKQMQYVRYLDIEMPERLVRIGLSFSRSFVSIRSDIPLWENAREDFAEAPRIFASHDLSGGFLVNYWGNLTLLLVVGFLAVMLTVLTFMCKRFGLEFWEIFFERLRILVACNLLIMILATNIDDLILHAALQIKTLSLGKSAAISTISFIVCMIFMVLGGILLFWAYYVVYMMKKNETRRFEEKPKKDPINFKEKYEWCQVIFRGFNSKYKINQFFFLIYLVRLGFPMMIVACAYKSPLIISIFEVIVSILITGFIGICRPFKKKVNFIQMLLFEVICLGMNICMLIININDLAGSQITDRIVFVGDIVIVGNDLINFLNIIFLIIKLVIEGFNLKNVVNKFDNVPYAIRATAWLQLLAIPLQQSCMGFEEMISGNPYETYLKKTGFMGVLENQAKKTKPKTRNDEKRVSSLFAGLQGKLQYGISDIESEEIGGKVISNKHDLSGTSFSDIHESNIALKKPQNGGSIDEIGEGEILPGRMRVLKRKNRPIRFSHDPSKYASWGNPDLGDFDLGKDGNETGLGGRVGGRYIESPPGSPGSPGSPSSPIVTLASPRENANRRENKLLVRKVDATKGLSQEVFKYF